MKALAAPMMSRAVRLEPLREDHRAALSAACAADADIWQIYPRDFGPAGFDAEFDAMLTNDWVSYAAFDGDRLVGMSSYIGIRPEERTLEIGATYFHPDVRGTAYNRTVKDLMIRRARDCGFERVLFKVDARNTRSQAAVLKLGATHLRTDRKDRTTWTGHVRDADVFALETASWTG